MLVAHFTIHPMASQPLDNSIWQIIPHALTSLRPHTIYLAAASVPLASLSETLRKILVFYAGLVFWPAVKELPYIVQRCGHSLPRRRGFMKLTDL
jgi:hypothetical protein